MFTMTCVPRDADTDLHFYGEVIANVSSRQHEAPRWTEIVINRTHTHKYVVHILGLSVKPDEVTRHHAVVAHTPEEIIAALTLPANNVHKGRSMSWLSKRALRAAAVHLPELEPLLITYI